MWYPASITSIDKITNQTWKFVIEPNEKFDFIPGQFIQLKIGETKRSYSIASYDPNNNFFELLIVKLDGGAMTKILFEDISLGQKIEIKGPIGRFTLPENIDTLLLRSTSRKSDVIFNSFDKRLFDNNKLKTRIYLKYFSI